MSPIGCLTTSSCSLSSAIRWTASSRTITYYRNVEHKRVLPEIARARDLDLHALLTQCDLSRPNVWSNWQTFALSGIKQSAFVPGAILEPAKSTLARLDFVGSYESLQADVRRLSEICGWNSAIPFPTANVTPRRQARRDLNPETLALIQDLNRDDLNLYEYARTLPRKTSPWPARATQGHEGSLSDLPSTVCARRERGTKDIFIRDLTVREANLASDVIAHGAGMEIQIDGESTIACADFVAGIRISDSLGFEVYGTNTLLLGGLIVLQPAQNFSITFSFSATLGAGKYYVTVAFHSQDVRRFHWIDNHSVFEILPESTRTFSGGVNLQAQLRTSFEDA